MTTGTMTAAEKKAAKAAVAKAKEAAAAKQIEANGGKTDIAALNEATTLHPDKVRDAHGEIAKPSSAGAKVIVGCKLGISYLDIQLCKIVEKFEQNMQGGRIVNEASRIGQVVRLRGTAYPRGTPPKGFPAPPLMVDGAALTMGVDKDFFDAWMDQNKLNPIVMNKMIFAHSSMDGINGQARELVDQLSGLEPVNPEGDRRMPKPVRSEISAVEKGVK